jgi:hypothetical protein
MEFCCSGLCVDKVSVAAEAGGYVEVVQNIDAMCGLLKGGSSTCGTPGQGNKKFYWIQEFKTATVSKSVCADTINQGTIKKC